MPFVKPWPLGSIKVMKSAEVSANSGLRPVENGDAFWASFFVAPGIKNEAKMDVKMDQHGFQRFEHDEQEGVQKR